VGRLDGETQGADGNATVGRDGDLGANAPDIGPPRAGGRDAKHRATLGNSQFMRSERGHAQFAVDFLGVVMETEKVDEGIGAGDARDVLCGKKRRETFLPEEMETLDLAFGLRGRSITQGHAIKSEGGSELGKGLRHRGEKEAVIIDIEGQRQAVLQESARQEVQVGQEGLPGINAGTGNESGAIVEDVEQGEVLLERRQPLVRGGIELPESAGILALPATNGGVGWPV